MQPTGGTDQSVGLAWAWQSLLPGGPLNAPAEDSNTTYNRVIILLSDGLNTEDRWPDCKTFFDAIGRPVRSGRRWVAVAAVLALVLLVGGVALAFGLRRHQQESVSTSLEPQGTPKATELERPKAVFAFNGKARIITPVERFAPVTLEAWVSIPSATAVPFPPVITSNYDGQDGWWLYAGSQGYSVNGAPIGGLKVVAEGGWFAARPSGTEDVYKIYGESFRGPEHLRRILAEAQVIVSAALAAPTAEPDNAHQ